MDKKPDKPNSIRLDVYELKDYKPVLNYRINVSDKIILSVDNKDIPPRGVTKGVNEKSIKEFLKITPLTPIENLDYGSQLTHKFQINKLGWKNLFLNLTDNDLIALGFIEKPPIIKFKLSENKRWIIGLIVVILIAVVNWMFNLFPIKNQKNKYINTHQIQEKNKMQPLTNQSEFSQSDSLTVPVDSTNILKNKNLHDK